MRASILACLLLAACGQSRSVQIVDVEGVAGEIVRYEVSIARRPPLGCEEIVLSAPLPARLEPAVVLSEDSASRMTVREGDVRFDRGEPVVVVVRGFTSECGVLAVGCEVDVAGASGPLQVDVFPIPRALYAPCVGTCEAGGRCAPTPCAGAGGACVDGNRDDGDGCSSDCVQEPGFLCDASGCGAATRCADYADSAAVEDGLYPLPGGEALSCLLSTPPGDWNLVAFAASDGTLSGFFGDSGFIGWSTDDAVGFVQPFAGRAALLDGFKRATADIQALQDPDEPAVLVRRIGEQVADRVTAPGCLYDHTAPATGPCATLTPAPMGTEAPPTLGVGDADTATNDPARGWRLHAAPGLASCDAASAEDFCGMDLYVR